MSNQSISDKSLIIRNETEVEANTKERISDVINDINETKAIAVLGKNKVNPNYVIRGFYFNTPNHEFTPDNLWRITENIPVEGNMISNHSIVGSGVCNLVLDYNREYLRRFDTQQYTYQEGDAYVVWSYRDEWNDFQVEEGTVSSRFEAYTDKNDVMSILMESLQLDPVMIDISESAEIINSVENGGIKRKFGFDVSSADTGVNSYIQAKPFSTPIKGSFVVSVVLNHIGHSSFMAWPGHINTPMGAGVTRFEKKFENVDETLNVIIFPDNMISGTERFFRVSSITITPLDVSSRKEMLKKIYKSIDSNVKMIDVSKSFNSTTEGWGVTRFSSHITAWEVDSADYLNGRKDRKTIFRLMPGFYDDYETKWAGDDNEDPNDGTYEGVIPKDNQKFTQFDTGVPTLTKVKWFGEAGYSPGFQMSSTQAMKKCVFHISDWIDGGVNVDIEGFHIITRNTRYCIHPETAGSGYKNKLKVTDCLLEWLGRPNVLNGGGTHIGIGISPGEEIIFKRIKCIGEVGGIGGHNNGWNPASQGEKPALLDGAVLIIEDCDFGGGDVYMQTKYNESDTPDSLIIKDSSNINTARFSIESPATELSWKGYSINSDIVNNEL